MKYMIFAFPLILLLAINVSAEGRFNKKKTRNCYATTTANINGDYVVTGSSKDLSHVVIYFCDGTQIKYDNLAGKTLSFLIDKSVKKVKVKSGCTEGYHEFECEECEEDLCGVCGGNNECLDCLGIPNGSAVIDDCGICNGDNQNKDCSGTCFGSSTPDECGVCDGPGKTGCDVSCGSDLKYDACGVCGGSATFCTPPPPPPSCKFYDECGVCEGLGKDSCGNCPSDPEYGSNNCFDCDGVPHGSKVFDTCGICDGDNTSCNCSITKTNPENVDTMMFKQVGFLTKIARKIRRKLNKITKLKLREDLNTANDLYMRTWELFWMDFGTEVLTCNGNVVVCKSEDVTPITKEINLNSQEVFRITKRYIRIAAKKSRRKKSKMISKAKAFADIVAEETLKLPTTRSICN